MNKVSLDRLSQCDNRLQEIMMEVDKSIMIIVICGYRGEIDQNNAYKDKKSKLKFPNSKHNTTPSKAVDVAPFPLNWKNKEKFKELSIAIKKIAEEKGIKIVWGGDWKMCDMPHYELV